MNDSHSTLLAESVTDDSDLRASNFKWLLIGLFIGNVTYLFGIYLVGLRVHPINYFSNVYLMIPLFGGSFGLLRLYEISKSGLPIRNTYRVALLWFSIGLLLWALGCAIGLVYSLIYNTPVPFPWWGDIFFASCFICWTRGIVHLYNVARLNFLKELRDIAPFLVLILMAAISVVLRVIETHRGFLHPNSSLDEVLAFLADLFFPVVDLFNLALLVTLLPAPAAEQLDIRLRRPLKSVVFGYFLLCIASYSFNLSNSLPSDSRFAYYNGGFTDGMFAAAFTVLSIAISSVYLRDVAEPRENTSVTRMPDRTAQSMELT